MPRPLSPNLLHGIGIDLISHERIEALKTRHQKTIYKRLLSPEEQQNIPQDKLTTKLLARIFSAKEAFFKALHLNIMGPDGFSLMTLDDPSASTFKIKHQDNSFVGDGTFFEFDEHTGAHVLVFDSVKRQAVSGQKEDAK